MAQADDPSMNDPDDGTWHHIDEGVPTMLPEAPTRLKAPESTEEPLIPGRGTVAGAETTPPPFATAEGKDSAESDETTPRPAGERTDDWDILPAPAIREGEIVFGKYLLEEKIGEGGMGEVWRVENVPLERRSALKLVKPEYVQNDKGWKRFEREARLMAKITHPNAVGIYDFRRLESMGYIEMEFVPGISLEKYLKDNEYRPMPLGWTAQLLEQLCSVLQVAHGYIDRKTGQAKPIIHRDLKPSNLMLADGLPDGQNLKVLDFGIAKMIQDEGSPELTGQGDFVGTPFYMSPEQIQGGVGKEGRGEIDGRSDIYAAGVLLYQLLTGKQPFLGRSRMEVLLAHLYQSPRPMREANPKVQVPPKVERLVMSCLERDPDLRPQTARELAEAFRAAIAEVPPLHVKVGPRKPPAAALAAACVVVVGMLTVGGLAIDRLLFNDHGSPSRGGGNAEPKSPKTSPKSEPATSNPWASLGYEPLTPDRLASIVLERGKEFTPGKPAADLGDAPAGLKHEQDIFYAFAPGVYLPLGYLPKDPNETDGAWPKVLVRASDEVRFIRVSGGTYTAGDFRPNSPVNDTVGHPLQPHQVKLSGFYIQETEVTNREIREYGQRFPDEPGLDNWKRACDLLGESMTRDNVDRCPAVCIDRATAQKYARRAGGRLPTEAEWEYAARSGGKLHQWACSSTIAARKRPPRAHLLSTSSTDAKPFPQPVMTFPEDQTDQKVFDMTGNVREWCLDVYRPYAAILAASPSPGQPWPDPRVGDEPEAAEPKVKYVARGGSSLETANEAMVFQRYAESADEQLSYLGFRVVIPCPPELGEPGQ
jgi:serine/threonine-protein kinase